jgi:hypothetical protein
MRTAAKLAIIAIGSVPGLMLGASTSHASDDAPWCAVLNLGMDTRWDCRYRTAEECLPNLITGDRGSCSPNPYGPASAAVAAPLKQHYKHRVEHD